MVGVNHGLGGSVEDAAVEANLGAYFLYLFFYEINFAVFYTFLYVVDIINFLKSIDGILKLFV